MKKTNNKTNSETKNMQENDTQNQEKATKNSKTSNCGRSGSTKNCK